MSTAEFLAHLRRLDVRLWADGERLRTSAPTGVLTPALLAELTARKATILAFLRTATGAAQTAAPPLHAMPRAGDLPLSFAQQRLWFLDQLVAGSPVYNIARAFRLHGPLDLPALIQSIDEIVRHEVLRTTFAVVDEQPVQVIVPSLTVRVPVVELWNLPALERESETQRLAIEEAQRPFDLARGPLIRSTLLRLGQEEHLLLLAMHHIVSDGWSANILYREIATLYEAFTARQPSPLPELPIQYADFALWQRQWLRGTVLEKHLAYWKEQLRGSPPLLDLPTDHPRPTQQTFLGALRPLHLSAALTRALTALSQQAGATLFMTLLAAFKTLLARYTAQADIVVGSPIANRTRVELEPLIGCFVNTLVLRTDLSGNPGFWDVLRRVQHTAVESYAHQDLPFERLVEELRPERTLSHAPLFQVMFAFQNTAPPVLRLAHLTVTPFDVAPCTAKFDLTLYMVEEAERLTAMLNYNADLFDATTIARMLRHFQTLLEGIVANPAQRLSDVPLLTTAERQQLLGAWNDSTLAEPQGQCLQQLFEAQVVRTPDALAVTFGEVSWTYAQLNARANQLAHYLRRRGVGPEVPVAICVERSLDMLVGVLGILKAGGAYVPMDPAFPQARLVYILEDTQARFVLTQEQGVGHLPANAGEVLCLPREHPPFTGEDAANPTVITGPDHLAYVVYTSGSTGHPKGVLSHHRGVVQYLEFLRQAYDLNGTDVVLQLAPLSFDASVRDLIGPLTVGARIVLVRDTEVKDPGVLLARITEQRVTCLLSVVPTVLDGLLAAAYDRQMAYDSLRLILVSGEALRLSACRKATEVFGQGIRVVNQYGPTECTMTSSYYPVVTPPEERDVVPIGRPIPQARIYILDGQLNPVPLGVPGELYIGGSGLARGYLNRPELTAEQFLPDPFSAVPGGRLYKTGDLARYLLEGSIEFLGRMDFQVKIRGFRIELEEIEGVLRQHPGVREAVVLAQEDTLSATRCLVAYVVAERRQSPTTTELRNFLQEKLPDHMIPSAFVTLDALPLAPNGKVDRRVLPAPDIARPEMEVPYVAPRTRREEVLAEIWADVLGLKQVGIYDNFFELGGHSLQAMRLVSRIAVTMAHDISIKSLFLRPSIAALAEALEEHPAATEGAHDASALPVDGAISSEAGEAFPTQPDAPSLQIERRPLLSLFATGKIPPVDAAALGYLPSDLLERTGLARDQVLHDWYDDLPTWQVLREMSLGRIASIILPRFRSDLYEDQGDLVAVIIEALELAGRLGARTVSLTGLIPSATDYGQAVATAISGRQDLPKISTGHATTAATVVFAINRILQEGGRDLAQERVGFLGLGSIGRTTLRLMLQCLPHPKEIMLCDVYSKLDALAAMRQELATDFGFRGVVRLSGSRFEVPAELYEATLIIGATNVPELLDIRRVHPGTMLVDDSGPHCFAVAEAVQRFQEHEDILFTAGGMLRSPHPIRQLRYVPRPMEHILPATNMAPLAGYHPFQITGCVLSGLLSACFAELKPTVGIVADQACRQHYDLLARLGFRRLTCIAAATCWQKKPCGTSDAVLAHRTLSIVNQNELIGEPQSQPPARGRAMLGH